MGLKVVCIDDDPGITEMLSVLLTRHGFEAVITNSGREGVDLVRQHAPDVVILDLMMPGMDGWQACRAIRAFSSVPILILSALDNPVYTRSALNAGADHFLVKPAPIAVMLSTLRDLAQGVIRKAAEMPVPQPFLGQVASTVED